ncbi:hypothetical protein KDW_22440 [Dictyobacter vulcani]|uniref:Uncharacterized protein n=1 Tax=Dictyobacter vulcani TaxID=2607529 RepID=A0A5J4KLV1_9CHLR|nr:hypothetical protein [Dictyobacter vulcani]GER88082.1 hypothetical protein KDW_22440 [Dictyobacter vulcani]
MKERLMLRHSQLTITAVRRWLVIIISLIAQATLLILLISNAQQLSHPEVTLAPIQGQPGACQVVSVTPFSEAWTNNVRVGSVIHLLKPPFAPAPAPNCQLIGNVLATSGTSNLPFTIHAAQPELNPLDIFITGFLAIIFALTGSAIF